MQQENQQPINGTNLTDFEAQLERAEFERSMSSRNVPKRYWGLPELQKTAWNYEGLQAAEDYVSEKINGIFFTGSAGTGKTVLACKILHELSKKFSARFVSVPVLLNEMRDSFQNKSHSNMAFVGKYVAYHTLVLDDLGAEKTSDWATEVLYLIINRRYEEGKGVIVTTNCSPAELSDRLGDRVISRLAEMCVRVKFDTDKDWRKLHWNKTV